MVMRVTAIWNLRRPASSVFSRLGSTLIFAEHEQGLVKQSSISAIEAAGLLNKENSVSVLLTGSGPDLNKAASHAASSHPLVSQVLVADLDMFLHPVAETCA